MCFVRGQLSFISTETAHLEEGESTSVRERVRKAEEENTPSVLVGSLALFISIISVFLLLITIRASQAAMSVRFF